MQKIDFVQYEQNPQLEVARSVYGNYSEIEDLAVQIHHEYDGHLFCGRYEDAIGPSFNSMEDLMAYQSSQALSSPSESSAYRLFWPYFIDQAGYKCFFDQPICRNDAFRISPHIMETGGWEAMINAYSGENFEDDPIAEFLYENQSIFLWWN